MSAGEDDDNGGQRAGDDAAEEAEADLLHHEADSGRGAELAGLRLRDREHDEEQRHADAVVQTALDVQTLANPRRQPRQRDDGLPECSIGGGEDHGEEQSLGPRERPEEHGADGEADDECQREPEPEQACGDRDLLA